MALRLLEQVDPRTVLAELCECMAAEIVRKHLYVSEARDVRRTERPKRMARGGAIATGEVALTCESLEHECDHPRLGIATSTKRIVDEKSVGTMEVPRSRVGDAEEEARCCEGARIA
jgi:hypothetical protein